MCCIISCCCNVKASNFVFIELSLRTHIVTLCPPPVVSIINKLRLLKVFSAANFIGNIDCQESKQITMGSFMCQVRKNIGELVHLYRTKFQNVRSQVSGP